MIEVIFLDGSNNNSNSGWDRISQQNDDSIKQNKRKEKMNTGYNIWMGLIAIITIVSIIIISVCVRLITG